MSIALITIFYLNLYFLSYHIRSFEETEEKEQKLKKVSCKYTYIYANEIDIPRLCKIFILELDQNLEIR